MTLEEYLRGRTCKGFSPVPHYNTTGDLIWAYFKDELAYSENLSPDLVVHRSMKTHEIVGVTIHGIKALIQKDSHES